MTPPRPVNLYRVEATCHPPVEIRADDAAHLAAGIHARMGIPAGQVVRLLLNPETLAPAGPGWVLGPHRQLCGRIRVTPRQDLR